MLYLIKFNESVELHTKINLFEWQEFNKKQVENFTYTESRKLMELDGRVINKSFFQYRPWFVIMPELDQRSYKRPTKISDLDEPFYYVIDINRFGMSIYYSNIINPDKVGSNQRLMHVLKHDDDWYSVQTWCNGDISFYKCDTFDGLLQLLKYSDIK